MLRIEPGPLLVTAAEMRAAEAATIAGGTAVGVLMARAADAAALAIIRAAPGQAALVLCGPGNNGGDGFGVATRLREAGVSVRVAADQLATAGPAAAFAAPWRESAEPFATANAGTLIIDAVFGTGLTRPLPLAVEAMFDRLRDCRAMVIALDMPSGIDSDTGAALGRPLAANLTIAFGALKRGHWLGDGRKASGRVEIADIGVHVPGQVRGVIAPAMAGIDNIAHKYQRGGMLVIAGEQAGATRLAALAALRAGAGAVTLVGGSGSVPADAIMAASDADALALLGTAKVRAVALGPGLGASQRGRDWLLRLLSGTTPIVLDAGALALCGVRQDVFAGATAPRVLTPHEGEFTRLFGPVGGDRIGAVQAAAVVSGGVVLLKGRETIIAAPDGQVAINNHATPWLATAGSGDVLTGIIAALLAQGLAPFDAAQAGAWLHGDAGRRGGAGLIADDLPRLLVDVLAGL